jgi:hypothetical protein
MSAARPHPLDVDLADLVDGVLAGDRVAALEAHLAACLLCRVKRLRLAAAPLPPPVPARPLPPGPAVPVPAVGDHPGAGPPAPGELWLAGTGERLLVLVLRSGGPAALVAPVTLDVEAADDTAVVVEAAASPLATGLAVYPQLAAELPAAALEERVGVVAGGADLPSLLAGTGGGPPVTDAADPRLDVRQHLADRLEALAADHPLRSALVGDLRSLRGGTCTVRPLEGWPDVPLAERAGWEPLLVVDEVGIVLVVLDTPHGLAGEDDFTAARSVLTRLNATALVVLASALSDLADVYDSPSLHHGIAVPSGGDAPPRPLISGLAPFDAVMKYLDQATGARAAAPPRRGSVARVDVRDVLREAASAAVDDAVRQAARFRIAPKRRGYESLGGAGGGDLLAGALERAFEGRSVVEPLLGATAEPEPEPEPGAGR